jgi:hypothetical protein
VRYGGLGKSECMFSPFWGLIRLSICNFIAPRFPSSTALSPRQRWLSGDSSVLGNAAVLVKMPCLPSTVQRLALNRDQVN